MPGAVFAGRLARSCARAAEDRAAALNAERRRARTRRSPAAPARVIPHIVVDGTQRVEPGTVLSYMQLREGDATIPPMADQALKALFATGLFADVKISCDGGTLTMRVVENPIINQVVFEGNDKVSKRT